MEQQGDCIGFIYLDCPNTSCYSVDLVGKEHAYVHKVGDTRVAVCKNQKKGGQSAPRIQRIRQAQVRERFAEAASLCLKCFYDFNIHAWTIQRLLVLGGAEQQKAFIATPAIQKVVSNMEIFTDTNMHQTPIDAWKKWRTALTCQDRDAERSMLLLLDSDLSIVGIKELLMYLAENNVDEAIVDEDSVSLADIHCVNTCGATITPVLGLLLRTGFDVLGKKYFVTWMDKDGY